MSEPTIADLDDWGQAFVTSLVPHLRAAFRRLVEGLPADEVVGLGAYTDSDATSIMAAVNTATNLERLGARHPVDRETFRWSTGEWDRTTVDVMERGGPDDLAAATAEAERAADAVLDREDPGRGLPGLPVHGLGGDRDRDVGAVRRRLLRPVAGWRSRCSTFPISVWTPATMIDWMAEMNTDAAAADFERWISSL